VIEVDAMNLEIWIAFVIAAEIILVIPGPTIILVVSQAIAHGRTSVIPLVAGVLAGDFTAMTLSLLGLGAVLSASATLFVVLKWVGALYLIYLGVKLWRTDPQSGATPVTTGGHAPWPLFKGAYIVTALNPKSIAFFVAFLPQFINHQHSTTAQFMILGATFLAMATANAALYAIFAGHLRDTMKKTRVRKLFDRCGGSALIGAGVLTAAMERS
jgi:threonine/homoserine/homoserine lactone efflux protein